MTPHLTFRSVGVLRFGPGCRSDVPALLSRLAAARTNMPLRPLLVIDPALSRAALGADMLALLTNAGIEPAIFDGIQPDPGIPVAEACAKAGRSADANAVIGLGGGSTLDIAKVAAVLIPNPSTGVRDLFGIDQVTGRGLPTVMLPTTAGTGSEVTPIAVLSDKEAQLKKGIVSPHIIPDAAVVDPELMQGVPARVTAYTGMDALTHAIEAYTNRHAHALVDMLALEAIRLIGGHLRRAVWCGDDLEARTSMAMASTLGGLCLGPVNTAAVHALAYPLGGTYDIPHGLANTLLLPHVMEFNVPADVPKFARIAMALGKDTSGLPERDAAGLAVEAVRTLARDIAIDVRLRDLGVSEDAIPAMATAAMDVTRLLNNNPRPVREADAAAIYRSAW